MNAPKTAVIRVEGAKPCLKTVPAVGLKLRSTGHAAAVFKYVRGAWKKISGGCHAMGSHGSARTAAGRMASATSERLSW